MKIEQPPAREPTIGMVSERFGLSAEALRWYERIGLLEPIRHGQDHPPGQASPARNPSRPDVGSN